MAYPVTINGRTYTLADFEGQNYVDGFPDALEDFVTQAGDIYNSTSTSSVTIGTGSKSFTTADSDKPYQVGTPLRIADAAAPSTNWMDCIVTSYSGTALVVDSIGYAGSGTISSWTINIGGAKTVDGTIAIAQGGTGATTAADAADNLGLGTTDAVTFGSATISGDLTVDTDTLFVDASANTVSIGSTTPATSNSAGSLGVAGVISVAAPLSAHQTSKGVFEYNNGTTKLRSYGATAGTGKIAFNTGGGGGSADSQAMLIDSSGNVGIGTANPQYLGHFVDGDVAIVDTDTTNNAEKQSLLFGGASGETATLAAITGYRGSNANFGELVFKTSPGTGVPTEVVRIDSSGNVGIGNSSPAYSMHIGDGTSSEILAIQASNTGNSHIFFGDAADVDAGRITYAHDLDAYLFTNNGNQERMRLDSSGNLLVGYTSSNGSYKLQVNSQIFATNSTIATSDQAFKENITPLTDGLNVISQLNPVSFDWKQGEGHNFVEHRDLGFIAQEVEQVVSGADYKEGLVKNAGAFKGMAYDKLTALLVKSIQEQQAIIESLTARIEALETN